MHYAMNRYYDPGIGRFISEDPVKDSQNWYVYCDNNPLKYTDPSGLAWVDDESDYYWDPDEEEEEEPEEPEEEPKEEQKPTDAITIDEHDPDTDTLDEAAKKANHPGWESAVRSGKVRTKEHETVTMKKAMDYYDKEGRWLDEDGTKSVDGWYVIPPDPTEPIQKQEKDKPITPPDEEEKSKDKGGGTDEGDGGSSGFTENTGSYDVDEEEAKKAAREFFKPNYKKYKEHEDWIKYAQYHYSEDYTQPEVMVTVGYTTPKINIGPIKITLKGAHHAYVIVTDIKTKKKWYTRCGEGGPGVNTIYGALKAVSDEWNYFHKDVEFDKHELTDAYQYIGTLKMSFSDAKMIMDNYRRQINARPIPYDPFGVNSNSYVHTFLKSLGFSGLETISGTKGWKYSVPFE